MVAHETYKSVCNGATKRAVEGCLGRVAIESIVGAVDKLVHQLSVSRFSGSQRFRKVLPANTIQLPILRLIECTDHEAGLYSIWKIWLRG